MCGLSFSLFARLSYIALYKVKGISVYLCKKMAKKEKKEFVDYTNLNIVSIS